MIVDVNVGVIVGVKVVVCVKAGKGNVGMMVPLPSSGTVAVAVNSPSFIDLLLFQSTNKPKQ